MTPIRRLTILSLLLLLAFITVTVAQQGAPSQQGGPGVQATPAGDGQGQGARGRGGRGGPPPPPSGPTPRWPDGRPRIGALPGERGIWGSCCGSLSNAQTPFQPWARALLEYRRDNEFEPHTRCKPSGGARQFVTPYGTEIVEFPDAQQILIFDIGGPHTFRTIFMDGKPHPKNLTPSYYGDSRGRWEGDTLVVETTGFNEGFWMDRAGSPHTEKLVFTERFTRTDFDTLRYEVTVDDPGAYTAKWTNQFQMRWNGAAELFEYVCQDNNFASELLVGQQESVDRTSVIVP
jgi:hypothetical protein